MNLPGYDNVLIMHRGEAAFTARRIADNGSYPPSTKDAIQARELAEAAPFWTDENAPQTRIEAPQWQWRDADGRIIRDQFQPIKSQREIDDADGLPSTAALVVMFAAAAAVALIMAGFDWMMGVV